jgi:hypothetical protein
MRDVAEDPREDLADRGAGVAPPVLGECSARIAEQFREDGAFQKS